jgi:UDP-glucose 4,6-dehydratase
VQNIVVTGGAGFIGSHIVERLHKDYPDAQILVVDKMTYAASVENLDGVIGDTRVELAVGDICDFDFCRRCLQDADLVVHAAAESHVDSSFGNSMLFTRTNVLGTHTLMEACRIAEVPRIIHISTDEVYGEVVDGAADENALLRPTNPYSASKAAAEMVIQGYLHSYGLPVIKVRANNIFGIRQFPEKLIPRSCLSLITGRKIPVHGNGENRRHFLAAPDLAEGVSLLIRKGEIGGIYNIGSEDEFTNLQVIRMICGAFNIEMQDAIEFVDDRLFNDKRYSIVSDRMHKLGWRQRRRLEEELPMVVDWYRANAERYLAGRYVDLIFPSVAG